MPHSQPDIRKCECPKEATVIVHFVRFKSPLPDEDVRQRVRCRLSEYRRVPGLLQKYYLRFPDTGEWGGLYLWDSHESLERFRGSELARSIPAAY